MPQPEHGTGPWGEAIRHWLAVRNIRQSELARLTGIEPKTISSVTRGFHTTTRIIEKIAIALKAPLDSVLVSPVRQLANEERKRMAAEITETVLRQMEQPPTIPYAAVQDLEAAIDAAEAHQSVTTRTGKKPMRRAGKKKPTR